ncbi:MAG: bifunctional N-acetylglucosamine-1-phosphate uridyltransferase/glucosamine-1-phosphate acetyltransferase [Bacteriovoracaceae bacterium]|nr:bifunctional N-acetylglucosamine-1-phosphate uridyltransferase/glucosamine-1-phosphate acetyltransferase [Bacteriovoracaceae bacterium]
MADSLGIVILAAGKGTRLKMDVPKSLCPLQGSPLVDHVLSNLYEFLNEYKLEANISLVVGHKKEEVEKDVSSKWEDVSFVWQKEQKGTAHALQCFFDQNAQAWNNKYTLVVCADTPLISKEEYEKLFLAVKGNDSIMASAAVFNTDTPTGYGRIVNGDRGFDIVEEKDASESERAIKTVNSGLYFFRTSHIEKNLNSIKNQNKSGEFYLTDLFKKDFDVQAVMFEKAYKFLGINNLVQLEQAAQIMQKETITKLQMSGVRFINSSSCYIENKVKINPGTVVYPSVVLEGETEIGEDCVIEAGVVIKNSTIGKASKVFAHSYLENAIINSDVKIGPMARIRPGSEIGEG